MMSYSAEPPNTLNRCLQNLSVASVPVVETNKIYETKSHAKDNYTRRPKGGHGRMQEAFILRKTIALKRLVGAWGPQRFLSYACIVECGERNRGHNWAH